MAAQAPGHDLAGYRYWGWRNPQQSQLCPLAPAKSWGMSLLKPFLGCTGGGTASLQVIFSRHISSIAFSRATSTEDLTFLFS